MAANREWRYWPPREQDLGGERFLLAGVRVWERHILELEESRVRLLVRPSGYLTGLSHRNRSLSAALPLAQANYRFFLDRLRVFRGLAPIFAPPGVAELVAAD